MKRANKRKPDELRKVVIVNDYIKNADASCLISFGDTTVLCAARIENSVPSFLKGQNKGWLTAEYSMLPQSSHQRIRRESSSGKLSGRTQEIQRLISRSLRASLDLSALGERQIVIDCDVINADGGTRTASITGAYIAMCNAIESGMHRGIIKNNPIRAQVAAISCGIVNDNALLDLDYIEDSNAQADSNFVLTSDSEIVEVQTTAEDKPFPKQDLNAMFKLASKGCGELFLIQREYIKQNMLSCF